MTETVGRSNGDLVVPLRARVGELEREILAATGSDRLDPGYERARRAAVVECLECWLFALERGECWTDPAPAAVRIHACKAAGVGVGLAALLRGYVRGRDLIWRAMMQEVGQSEAGDLVVVLRQGWAAMESLSGRVLGAVEDAYTREVALRARSAAQCQADLVRRLLASDRSVDLDAIPYDFAGRHLGLIAAGGERARRGLRVLAERAGARLFLLPEQDGILAGWLRLRRELGPADLDRCLPAEQYPDLRVAFGRAGDGLDGFCLTHRLAVEAFMVAERRPARVTWHADVELDAMLLRDQQFAGFLIDVYIAPLDWEAQQTLVACGVEDWNESAAARALDVSRNTIRDRLQRAEIAIGRPISESRFSIELAIRAFDLDIGGSKAPSTPQIANSTEQPVQN